MPESSLEERRQQVIARLQQARESYQATLQDVSLDVAYQSSEWSVADLLRHVNGEVYRNHITRLTGEQHPEIARFDRQIAWPRLVDATLKNNDEALAIASSLTEDELGRQGTRSGQPYSTIDALENWAAHFEEHLAQLRDEVRPREGLPSRP